MKRIVLLGVILLNCLAAMSQVNVWVSDKDSITNVRNAPKGKVVGHLETDDMITVDSCVNGWFRIANNYYQGANSEGKISETSNNLWIHSSVITADWIWDGNHEIVIYQGASAKSKILWKGKGLNHSIEAILDVRGNWTKVRTKSGISGWVESRLICGNPYTVCC
ncbi:MAG: hypothetical protein MJZ99_08080 [Bacteroidales bacterium]|nr:hypothetical protein [Candidatus Colimorpha merdihippi]MCQ2282567.1 hypothetical protein [Bacteroidales bacterium]